MHLSKRDEGVEEGQGCIHKESFAVFGIDIIDAFSEALECFVVVLCSIDQGDLPIRRVQVGNVQGCDAEDAVQHIDVLETDNRQNLLPEVVELGRVDNTSASDDGPVMQEGQVLDPKERSLRLWCTACAVGAVCAVWRGDDWNRLSPVIVRGSGGGEARGDGLRRWLAVWRKVGLGEGG